MTDLVTQMPEHGSVGFLLLHPRALTLHVIGFRDVDRDQAVAMSRQHTMLITVGQCRVPEKFECATLRILRVFANNRQPQINQALGSDTGTAQVVRTQLHCRHEALVRQIRQRMSAVQTLHILEKDEVSAR